MSLQEWHDFGWLKPHATSLNELSNLLAIADRDIEDAETDGGYPIHPGSAASRRRIQKDAAETE